MNLTHFFIYWQLIKVKPWVSLITIGVLSGWNLYIHGCYREFGTNSWQFFSQKVGNSHEMKDNLNLNLRKLDNHHSWSWIMCHIKITRSGKSNIYSRCKLTFKLFTVLYIFNWHPITLHMNNLFIIIEITAIITKNPLNPGKKSPILALIQFQSPSLTEIKLL